ncbi:hypothetical protein B9T25_07950 [Acinetobacter sp. ANC 4470]|uniref:OmpW/AlkL family protein n=1 Tax=Acinetobacter sp. ANC 4470 TaxID=1977881 RepID=UPI000A34C188|nr:OmpW family outer membrane protein [Acinetobacter sp. ANC 4470]OTG67903.1 hypothetical protein B9T25_07950 [Acinetobacter sp. ANC 4470]
MKLGTLVVSIALLGATQSGFTATEGGFKRFSVSAGWLHVMPQGKANPFNINTAVAKGTKSTVGAISAGSFLNAINPDAKLTTGENAKEVLNMIFDNPRDSDTGEYIIDPDTGKPVPSIGQMLGFADANNIVSSEITGVATIDGLDQWTQNGTGLEAEDVDTLGLTLNYYINDNVSLQLIGGFPPKVDIKGVGEITAPLSGFAVPGDAVKPITGDMLSLLKDIPITNLGAQSKAATARAWTPVLEAQYQFGKSGVNKFRPYVGAGLMYAYFNDIKLNGQIESDLIVAGHMIQNVLDNKAGAALDGKISSGEMRVKVDADDAIAPVVTAGFTYDLNENWYGVASVSYAKLSNKATINVVNQTTGAELIHATTKIDIDPIITYLGVGYRF